MEYTVSDAQVEEVVMMADLDMDQVYWDYSGRGMYGRTCIGYSGSHHEGQLFGFALAAVLAAGEDECAELVPVGEVMEFARRLEASTDSLGLSAITYWTNVQAMENADR